MLIQLSTLTKDYIIDVLRVRSQIKEALKLIGFEDSHFIKIFHGCDSDLQLLAVKNSIARIIIL